MTAAAPLTIQVRERDVVSDYSLGLTGKDVTVAEVFAALGLGAETLIDGRHIVHPERVCAGEVINAGSVLERASSAAASAAIVPAQESSAASHVVVSVVAGLDAGGSVELVPGLHHLDLSRDDVDPDQASAFYVNVDDASGSCQVRPWHEQASQIEAVWGIDNVLAVGPPVGSEAGFGSAVHRPPRQRGSTPISPIVREPAPPEVAEPPRLSWATLLAPIPIAVMMAMFFRPIFALFAAMGPIMALGRWVESRRRCRRQTAERDELVGAQQIAFDAALANQSEAVARQRWCANPHVAELWRRARSSSVRLWERRPGQHDYLHVSIGVGPDTSAASLAETHEVQSAPPPMLKLRPVPHVIDLQSATGVGVHGHDRPQVLAVAFALVLQAVTLQGPADLTIGLMGSRDAVADWDWLKWIPHLDRRLTATRTAAIVRQFNANAPSRAETSAHSWSQTRDVGPVILMIVDDLDADVAALQRAATANRLHVRFVVVAPRLTALPAVCSAAVEVHGSSARIASAQTAGAKPLVCPIGVSCATATRWARSLAGLIDPELDRLASGADQAATLFDVLDFGPTTRLAERWSARQVGSPARAPLGRTSGELFTIDLTQDGPHCLIAGTTGSGKSELLRTLVAGLAAESPPEYLNFVLIDFKGGGAFDVVDRLPHVAGLITDLDETLIERAITSLRAELQRRERLFRQLQVSDFAQAVLEADEPLARLVVVIDEFAALATEYGELMTAIVDLAARGRSLGMHLVLATQRPSGVVDQKIRANTNLRIALRVQDAFDSHDVVGTGDAAAIDRTTPGRAIVRVGGDPPVTIQTAFGGGVDLRSDRCRVEALALGESLVAGRRDSDAAPVVGQTELQVLVDSIVEASAARNQARSLWADPLPTALDWIDLGSRMLEQSDDTGEARPGTMALGLEDVPARQTQQPWRWDPSDGPLAILAASAGCAAKTLLSIAAATALAGASAQSHLYIIDGGAGGLALLHDRHSTGAYITLAEPDRVQRAVAFFESTLADRRHGHCPGSTRIVLMIENLAAVLDSFDDIQAADLVDRLSGLARDGSPLGVHLVVSVRTVRDLRHRLAQQFPHRLVLALADMSSYLTLGLRASEVPMLSPMRAIDLATRRQVQIVEPPSIDTWAEAVDVTVAPEPIHTLPTVVEASKLAPATNEHGVLLIPVGVDADQLQPAQLTLQPDEHALVVARNGLGRTTALQLLGEQIMRSDAGVLVGSISCRSPLFGRLDAPHASISTPEELEAFMTHEASDKVILVDDADRLAPDLAAQLRAMIDEHRERLRIVAATTPEQARSLRQWFNPIRASGTGLLLPGSALDGDIFAVRLPALAGLGQLAGRGFTMVRGQAQPVQLALPRMG